MVAFNKPVTTLIEQIEFLDATHQHTHLSMVLSILTHMMKRINSKNTWRDQLFSLFETFNEIPLGNMDLPADWKEDEFWK